MGGENLRGLGRQLLSRPSEAAAAAAAAAKRRNVSPLSFSRLRQTNEIINANAAAGRQRGAEGQHSSLPSRERERGWVGENILGREGGRKKNLLIVTPPFCNDRLFPCE